MISVVITTKDRKELLLRAVNSVLENTVMPSEIIIVNDGGDIVSSNEFQIPRDIAIEIINNEYSLGGNKARNQGAEKSKGKYLFFLDDDDAYTPQSIESRISYFSDMNVGLVYTGKKFVKSNSLEQVYYTSEPYHEGDLEKKLLKFGNVIGTTSCVAVRREVFDLVGGFDEGLNALQDYDLWIRVSRICEIKHDRCSNLIYTIHNNHNQISSNYLKYLQAGVYLYEKYKSRLMTFGVEKNFLASRYLRVSIVASKHSSSLRLKYAFLSLKNKVSIKALFMILPVSISKKIRSFH